MSFDAIRWSWTVPRLTPTQRLVLLAICDAANNSGECWPSQACLAEKTGLTDRSVRSALKALEERGLLSRKYRANNSGRTSDLITVGRPVNATERARCQKSNGQTTPIDLPELQETTSATQRKEIPESLGTTFRESTKDEPTRHNQEDIWDNDLWMEMIPGDPSADIHNRAQALFEIIRGPLSETVDHGSPGIKNTGMLKSWVTRFEPEFVAQQILMVIARRKGDKARVRSWRYFAEEIERAAKENPSVARK
jgi:hypothetical protein